ncbi:MAG: cation:proton antiporter [archaeon]
MELLGSVVFQMALLLFVALAGYLIAMRINQSAVVGIILVGVLVGPSLLGLITYTEFISGLAELGAIFMLFVIGLEFRIDEIAKIKYVIIALVGVIVPWLGGYVLAKLFHFPFGNAVIIGAALTATSIAITANVLKEMGKLHLPLAKTIIAIAVIDDVLALLVLSMSTNAIAGIFSMTSILLLLGKAVLFLLLGMVVGYFYVSRLIIAIDRSKLAERYPELVFIIALLFAFLCALVSHIIGLSAIVGAFLAGVSLKGLSLRKSKSYQEGTEYLYIVFSAIFFVSLGVLVNIRIVTWFIVLFVVALTLLAVLTKIIGCGLPALFFGYTPKDSLAIGCGMSPRGEVAMIVALLGLNAGIIGQNIYVALVLMALLTTVITPFMLKEWFFKERIRP